MTIQSVHNVADLLRLLAEDQTELGVMELSRASRMHKSTVSRLLSSMHAEGLVSKNPQSGKYSLGLQLIHLGMQALDRLDLRKISLPFLQRLADSTQETINLAVLDRRQAVNVESLLSPHPLKFAGQLGRRTPLHCTSTGRVLLAHLEPELRGELLDLPLPAFTSKTITDRLSLAQILESVYQQGYAVVIDEFEEGLTAIAAPLRDHRQEVVAAISITGPSFRLNAQRLEAFRQPLRETAAGISSALGA